MKRWSLQIKHKIKNAESISRAVSEQVVQTSFLLPAQVCM